MLKGWSVHEASDVLTVVFLVISMTMLTLDYILYIHLSWCTCIEIMHQEK